MSNAVTNAVSVPAVTHAPNPKSQELQLFNLKRQSFGYVGARLATVDRCHG